MERNYFIKNVGVFGWGLTVDIGFTFSTKIVENVILKFKKFINIKDYAWLFDNFFPNTFCKNVYYSEKDGNPETNLIKGDIDAICLRATFPERVFDFISINTLHSSFNA